MYHSELRVDSSNAVFWVRNKPFGLKHPVGCVISHYDRNTRNLWQGYRGFVCCITTNLLSSVAFETASLFFPSRFLQAASRASCKVIISNVHYILSDNPWLWPILKFEYPRAHVLKISPSMVQNLLKVHVILISSPSQGFPVGGGGGLVCGGFFAAAHLRVVVVVRATGVIAAVVFLVRPSTMRLQSSLIIYFSKQTIRVITMLLLFFTCCEARR